MKRKSRENSDYVHQESESPAEIKPTANPAQSLTHQLKIYTPALLLTLLPLAKTYNHWIRVINGFRPRAWDGTGHYALAQIYSEKIFPDTFGWTNAYFAGMPFPNFYPPLFFWLIALINHVGLSLLGAFKVLVSVPVILIPIVIWFFARSMFKTELLVAFFAGLGAVILLLDYHFISLPPLGLDYFSTFQVGLYTQPLGFILLIVWLVFYLKPQKKHHETLFCAALLSLVILANFFNAITAGFFIAAAILCSSISFLRQEDQSDRKEDIKQIIVFMMIPVMAVLLAAFWLAPMLIESKYLVTRPTIFSFENFISVPNVIWYLISLAGFLCWLKKSSITGWIYFFGCLFLLISILFGSLLPDWFPFQSNRFISTFNFLLCVPAGHCISFICLRAIRLIMKKYSFISSNPHYLEYIVKGVFLLLCLLLIKPVDYELAFFQGSKNERVDAILTFALHHTDGRYLVEVPSQQYAVAQLDGRAISAYLGLQGNEAANVVFRESSPNSLFYNPLGNKFSAYNDSYGISSILSDDIDFTSQPLEASLRQAQFLGIRYLTIISPWIKDKLNKSPQVTKVYDFGGWSIFRMNQDTVNEKAIVLSDKPFLVVSAFSFKKRKSDDFSFVRLAEEQFSDGIFDFTLVESANHKIDELSDLDKFSGLIINDYDYKSEDVAYNLLYNYAREHPLILISSDNELFIRLQQYQNEMPQLIILDRPLEMSNHDLISEQPTARYNLSAVRQFWGRIRNICKKEKKSIDQVAQVALNTVNDHFDLHATIVPNSSSIPVLIKQSYHPNWRRTDGQPVYWAGPFYMLTFVDHEETNFVYSRNLIEEVSFYLSFVLWLGIGFISIYQGWKRWHSQKRASAETL